MVDECGQTGPYGVVGCALRYGCVQLVGESKQMSMVGIHLGNAKHILWMPRE